MNKLLELESVAPGITKLSPDEIAAIHEFTLVWTLFEAQALDSNASVSKIIEKVKVIDSAIISGDWFNEQLSYFTERYTNDGVVNSRFNDLYFRKNDNPNLVCSVLSKECVDPVFQLIACLTIVYRIRNNFFHGLKWAFNLQDQFYNFTHSSKLLIKYLGKVK